LGSRKQTTTAPPIHFKTLLNKVHRFKSFVYQSVRLVENGEDQRIIAEIIPRANARPVCSGCGKHRPGYDCARSPREFEFIPVWNIPVSFSYAMRRVDCPDCGVKVEAGSGGLTGGSAGGRVMVQPASAALLAMLQAAADLPGAEGVDQPAAALAAAAACLQWAAAGAISFK
jgi:hypothetical protein